MQKNGAKFRPSEWWYDEDGLFNLDDEGRAEKQLCAVAASNIIRNFSFMPENEVIMAANRHCLETVFQCIEDHTTGEDLIKQNAISVIYHLNLNVIVLVKLFGKFTIVSLKQSRHNLRFHMASCK